MLRRTLHDRPFRVDGLLVLLVALHWLATVPPVLPKVKVPRLPDVWAPLSASAEAASAARDLYLAMLGPSAIVAGFAGVVVVFGLTTDAPRFREFRAEAGASLKRTWISSSLSGFVACFVFVLAAVVSLAGAETTSPFLFELGVLVLAHGALRLLWILRGLIGIKAADDVQAVVRADEIPLSRLPWKDAG